MMASKARLFGDDTAFLAILASKDPREQKLPRSSSASLCPRAMAIRMRKHCTTWQPCKIFPKRGDATCPYSNRQPPPRRSKTNATADLSACNGTSAILGQHKACPDRDDSERTRSVTTPSVPLSHDAENAFLTGKKTPPFIMGKQLRWMHNTNATADVSPCNGIPRFSASTKPVPRSR